MMHTEYQYTPETKALRAHLLDELKALEVEYRARAKVIADKLVWIDSITPVRMFLAPDEEPKQEG